MRRLASGDRVKNRNVETHKVVKVHAEIPSKSKNTIGIPEAHDVFSHRHSQKCRACVRSTSVVGVRLHDIMVNTPEKGHK